MIFIFYAAYYLYAKITTVKTVTVDNDCAKIIKDRSTLEKSYIPIETKEEISKEHDGTHIICRRAWSRLTMVREGLEKKGNKERPAKKKGNERNERSVVDVYELCV